MKHEWKIEAESELLQLTGVVRKELERVATDGAVVLALHGDLGAGKTTFMQHLARSLGVTKPVTSPTFVVMKTYELEEQPWNELVHIDAYRIEDVDEMRPLRFSELLTTPKTVVCIEWAEKIATLLPSTTLHLHIVINDDSRVLTLS